MTDVVSWEPWLLKQDWLFLCGALKSYKEEQIGKLAGEIAESLSKVARLAIPDAQEHYQVLAARKFLKIYKSPDSRMDECRKQLLALKLGIQASVFDHNPGFRQFAEKTHLERYLMEYPHPLEVDPQTQVISLLAKNVLTPWNEALLTEDSEPLQVVDCVREPWLYGPQGIQRKDMYQWTKLEPFKTGKSTWGGRYIFEFCVCGTPTPAKTGDHSWIRLKTPTGDVYSVGLYRPGKQGWDNINSPMRIKRGHLMQPDVSEFWPLPIKTIAVEINEKNFHEMVAQIEQDQKEDKQVFQLYAQNCVLYTKKIARIAGIEIDTIASTYKVLTRLTSESFFAKIEGVMPDWIVKVCRAVFAFFVNLSSLILGASKVDPKVIEHNGDLVQPHISCFSDLFDPGKADLHHPNTLGYATRHAVLKWRDEQIEILQKKKDGSNDAEIEKQIDDISYRLPPI